MNNPVGSRFEAMPLDEEVEGGQRKGKPRLEGRPRPMGDFLQVTDAGYHRQYGLDQHPGIPEPAVTEFEVCGIALFGMESPITEHDHLLLKSFEQRKEGPFGRISPGTVPRDDQPKVIEQQTEFATHNPTMIRFPFAADLLSITPLAPRVGQF